MSLPPGGRVDPQITHLVYISRRAVGRGGDPRASPPIGQCMGRSGRGGKGTTQIRSRASCGIGIALLSAAETAAVDITRGGRLLRRSTRPRGRPCREYL